MFSIYFVNFGYYSQTKYKTLDDVIAACKRACFDCAIYQDDDMVASWSYFSGVRYI